MCMTDIIVKNWELISVRFSNLRWEWHTSVPRQSWGTTASFSSRPQGLLIQGQARSWFLTVLERSGEIVTQRTCGFRSGYANTTGTFGRTLSWLAFKQPKSRTTLLCKHCSNWPTRLPLAWRRIVQMKLKWMICCWWPAGCWNPGLSSDHYVPLVSSTEVQKVRKLLHKLVWQERYGLTEQCSSKWSCLLINEEEAKYERFSCMLVVNV